MSKALIRPAMLFFPFIVGFCFPQIAVLNEPPISIIRYMLIAMVFLSSLQAETAEFAIRKEHFAVMILNIVIGFGGFLLCRMLFPNKLFWAQAVFFCGIMPTATAAPVVVSFLGGSIGFAVTGFLLGNIIVPIVTVFLLPEVCGEGGAEFLIKVFSTIIITVFLPLVLARCVRRLTDLSAKCKSILKNISFTLWSMLLAITSAIATNFFAGREGSLRSVAVCALISLLVCIVNFAAGYIFAPGKKFRRECSQICGQKNTTLGIYLALTFCDVRTAFATVFYVLWHNLYNAAQLFIHERQNSVGKPDDPD